MPLPNLNNAVIESAKLRDYLLSPEHPIGRFKAVFFQSLGYNRTEWERLEADLRQQHLVRDAVQTSKTKYGQKFEIRARIKGPNGASADVVSVWIVLANEDFPRFVTAYPGVGR